MDYFEVGDKVIRGPDWGWDNQDDSVNIEKQQYGVVTTVNYYQYSEYSLTELKDCYTVGVRWPDGSENTYRHTRVCNDLQKVKSFSLANCIELLDKLIES